MVLHAVGLRRTSPHRPRRRSRSRWSAHSAAAGAGSRFRRKSGNRKSTPSLGEVGAQLVRRSCGFFFCRGSSTSWSLTRMSAFGAARATRGGSRTGAKAPFAQDVGRRQLAVGCFLYCANVAGGAVEFALQHHIVVDHGDDAIDGLRDCANAFPASRQAASRLASSVFMAGCRGVVVGGVVVDADGSRRDQVEVVPVVTEDSTAGATVSAPAEPRPSVRPRTGWRCSCRRCGLLT